jgi:hypothetical protein
MADKARGVRHDSHPARAPDLARVGVSGRLNSATAARRQEPTNRRLLAPPKEESARVKVMALSKGQSKDRASPIGHG